jgi:PAS domain S-box-containing protein
MIKMVKKKVPSYSFKELRRQAEELLCKTPAEIRAISGAEIKELVHELQVHQIELEMQNEELQKTQRELEESRDRYYDLYDFAPVGYVTVDNGLITAVNLTGAAMLGVERRYLIKKYFTSFISPAFRDAYYLHSKRVFDTGTKQTCEVELVKKDGTLFYALLESIAVQDTEGKSNQIRTALTDISDLKRTDAELRKSEEKYRQLVERAQEGILAIDKDACTTFVNPRMAEMLGYPVAEMQGKHLFSFMDEDGVEIAKMYLKRHKEGVKEPHDFEFLRKDGSRVFAALATSPITDDNGNYLGALAGAIDITERRQAEDQLKASLKEKEVLLREIHHRVKNNLQVVSSLLNMQARATKSKDAFATLSEARNRINTIALIHSQLYESENLSAINMKGFLDKLLVQLLQIHSVPDRKITSVFQVAEYPLPISTAVPVGLIANELLTNAFKHAFVNRKNGMIEVSLGASGNGKIALTVSDDGVGLPEGFDINASKTLGLHVVKILAEDQLNGKLEVTSDKGTSFKVDFEMAEG